MKLHKSHGGNRRVKARLLRNTILAVGFTGFIGMAAFAGRYPWPVFYLIVVVSLLAMVLYAKDKIAAVRNHWRVSESTLHILSVLGGWPGALMAQGLFNHKTTKRSFRVLFWLTVAINCSLIAWTFSDSGEDFLQNNLVAGERMWQGVLDSMPR